MDPEDYLARFNAAASYAEKAALAEEARERENDDRGLFARHRENWTVPELEDQPLRSMVPVFDPSTGAARFQRKRFPEEDDLPRLFQQSAGAPLAKLPPTVQSLAEFEEQFHRLFSSNMLQFLNWDNVVAAGGAVAGCTQPVPPEYAETAARRRYFHDEQFASSDVDLFLWGLTEEQANAKLIEIYEAVSSACPFDVVCFRSAHAVTMVSKYPFRHIQVVLRLYSSPYEVLAGFDVDSCTFAYDGHNVYSTPRGHFAICSGYNTVDMSRRSPSYEMRLAKYASRGFEVVVGPDFDRARVDPNIYDKPFYLLRGLSKLLVLEKLRTAADREAYQRRQRSGASSHGRYYWRRHDVRTLERIEKAGGSNDASDYSTVFLPWGPSFDARSTMRLMKRKDLKLNGPWFARDRPYNLHPCFFGTAEEVLEDCAPDDPPIPEDVPEADLKDYVRGPLTWLRDNPGRQQIGSFNPITEGDWTEGAFFLESTSRLQQAVNADDVAALRTELDALRNGPDGLDPFRRDVCGRTLLHLAVMAGSSECAIALLDEQAVDPALRMPDGRNALHLAAQYNMPRAATRILAAVREAETRYETELAEFKAAAAADAKAKRGPAAARESELDVDGDADDSDDLTAPAAGSLRRIVFAEVVDCRELEHTLTPLHMAVVLGHVDMVQLLVQDAKADVRIPVPSKIGLPSMEKHISAFRHAVKDREWEVWLHSILLSVPMHLPGATDIVDTLLAAGAAKESHLMVSGTTNVFHIAAAAGNVDLIDYLLTALAKPVVDRLVSMVGHHLRLPISDAIAAANLDCAKSLFAALPVLEPTAEMLSASAKLAGKVSAKSSAQLDWNTRRGLRSLQSIKPKDVPPVIKIAVDGLLSLLPTKPGLAIGNDHSRLPKSEVDLLDKLDDEYFATNSPWRQPRRRHARDNDKLFDREAVAKHLDVLEWLLRQGATDRKFKFESGSSWNQTESTETVRSLVHKEVKEAKTCLQTLVDRVANREEIEKLRESMPAGTYLRYKLDALMPKLPANVPSDATADKCVRAQATAVGRLGALEDLLKAAAGKGRYRFSFTRARSKKKDSKAVLTSMSTVRATILDAPEPDATDLPLPKPFEIPAASPAKEFAESINKSLNSISVHSEGRTGTNVAESDEEVCLRAFQLAWDLDPSGLSELLHSDKVDIPVIYARDALGNTLLSVAMVAAALGGKSSKATVDAVLGAVDQFYRPQSPKADGNSRTPRRIDNLKLLAQSDSDDEDDTDEDLEIDDRDDIAGFQQRLAAATASGNAIGGSARTSSTFPSHLFVSTITVSGAVLATSVPDAVLFASLAFETGSATREVNEPILAGSTWRMDVLSLAVSLDDTESFRSILDFIASKPYCSGHTFADATWPFQRWPVPWQVSQVCIYFDRPHMLDALLRSCGASVEWKPILQSFGAHKLMEKLATESHDREACRLRVSGSGAARGDYKGLKSKLETAGRKFAHSNEEEGGDDTENKTGGSSTKVKPLPVSWLAKAVSYGAQATAQWILDGGPEAAFAELLQDDSSVFGTILQGFADGLFRNFSKEWVFAQAPGGADLLEERSAPRLLAAVLTLPTPDGDVGAVDDTDCTLLSHAIKAVGLQDRQVAMLKWLLEREPELARRTTMQREPLLLAASVSSLPAIKVLLFDAKVSPSVKSRGGGGMNVLHYLIAQNKYSAAKQVAEWISELHGPDMVRELLFDEDAKGTSAIMHLSASFYPAAFEALLTDKHSGKIDAETLFTASGSSSTPLHKLAGRLAPPAMLAKIPRKDPSFTSAMLKEDGKGATPLDAALQVLSSNARPGQANHLAASAALAAESLALPFVAEAESRRQRDLVDAQTVRSLVLESIDDFLKNTSQTAGYRRNVKLSKPYLRLWTASVDSVPPTTAAAYNYRFDMIAVSGAKGKEAAADSGSESESESDTAE